ncbi:MULTISPECIES: flagellar basal-body rod protein FlgF [Gammaproteobacteria]|uniref:flagellar basal-body rod protein FlgF n=1 Tax=Gammaproteobacteria TaxID=1236 RepID=UPI000DCF6720|nr:MULTISPECIES: flagellar basal-body rod protein FlgF [Gammaproteobacteria]RTE86161.1 flagellar basal-body rod protein FlgF [Aliidiomarina sp. B3213]TCZ91512.1 flagellar basal-body rod protein FlgF [Lysobacter sp. N42]
MDDLLYIAMSGAKENMNGIALRANNLANANTTGFKADLQQARAMQAYNEGLPTRVFSMTERPGQNFADGAFRTTGRALDVAVSGPGWLAVSDANGNEAYTRNGNLQMDANGMLQTSSGQPVLGENGPIFVPVPIAGLFIGNDGTISVRPEGAPENVIETVDRIKLVNPVNRDLEKLQDGLFRMKDGGLSPADGTVRIEQGAIESSNVNAIEEMTNMISLQRNYEINVKMMKTAQENDQRSEQLMRIF